MQSHRLLHPEFHRQVVVATFLLQLPGLSLLADSPSPSGAAPVDSIRPGHNLLEDDGARPALSVGESLGRLSFRDLAGKPIYLEKRLREGPLAFVFLSTTCPLAKRYVERLKRLDARYSKRGASLIGVFSNGDETADGIRAYCERAGFAFPNVRDVGGYLAKRLGATITPQALLLGVDSTLLYRGPIDDNRYETRVRKSYLAEALDAALAGEPVTESSPRALGCVVHLPEPPAADSVVYTTHVARILQDNCQSCHRTGQVAPFALTNYDEAYRWRREIKAYTEKRLMPPWKAVPGFGEFRNDTSLTSEEIDLLAKWVDAGGRKGPTEDMPPPPAFPDGWAYGEPDLVVEMPEEYVIAPEGEDDYRHFIVPYEHKRSRFIKAVDVQPGNRSTVHHVIAYVDTSGTARELDAEDPGPGYTRFGGVGFEPASVIGGWAPGNRPVKTLPGTGRWLPRKGDIVLQVHYYRTGFEERDRTRLGIYFTKERDPTPTRSGVVINQDFNIPPGAERHEVRASLEVEQAVHAFSVTPHMHLLGETMVVTATLPDSKVLPLVKIDDWDFNWQVSYHFRDLVYLPAGTRIDLVATFDNSTKNPNNPNRPPKAVGWGERTTDEMCIAFVGWLRAAEYDPTIPGRPQDR